MCGVPFPWCGCHRRQIGSRQASPYKHSNSRELVCMRLPVGKYSGARGGVGYPLPCDCGSHVRPDHPPFPSPLGGFSLELPTWRGGLGGLTGAGESRLAGDAFRLSSALTSCTLAGCEGCGGLVGSPSTIHVRRCSFEGPNFMTFRSSSSNFSVMWLIAAVNVIRASTAAVRIFRPPIPSNRRSLRQTTFSANFLSS